MKSTGSVPDTPKRHSASRGVGGNTCWWGWPVKISAPSICWYSPNALPSIRSSRAVMAAWVAARENAAFARLRETGIVSNCSLVSANAVTK